MKRFDPLAAMPFHLRRAALASATATALLSLAACGANTGSDPSSGAAPGHAELSSSAPGTAENMRGADAYTHLPAPNAGIDFDAEPRPDGLPIGQESSATGTFATKALPTAARAGTEGAWGPQLRWPFIPIHAIILPDGRMMTYGSLSNGQQGAKFHYDVWDPTLGTGDDAHLTLPNTTQVDLFCSAQVLLPLTGELFIAGGDVFSEARGRSTNQPNNDTTIFRPRSNTIEKSNPMLRPRWYATTTVLPNGEVFIQGGKGGNDHPEIRRTDGSLSLLTGIRTADLREDYPRNWVAPDGKIFGFSRRQMYRMDPAGNGSRTNVGTLDYRSEWEGSAVMFQPGRILMTEASGNRAAIIDIRSQRPVVSDAGTMTNTRMWNDATVLADGTVAVTGGAEFFDFSRATARNPIYSIDLWNPKTNRWTRGPSQKRMRLYHSVSILLPDGSLYTGGGGAGGPETNLNAEIYYPPYLYDANGRPAARPHLASAPSVVQPAGTLSLQSPDAASIHRVTLVALGSVTHSFDMGQRFIELDFRRHGNRLDARLPANIHDTPPGYYMVFILNNTGTPSLAKIVRVNVAAQAGSTGSGTAQPAPAPAPTPEPAPTPAPTPTPTPAPDTVAPSRPGGLRAQVRNNQSVSLSWRASTDTGGSGLAGYRVRRDGVDITPALLKTPEHVDRNLQPGTHTYTVEAIDGAANVSAASGRVRVTVQASRDAIGGAGNVVPVYRYVAPGGDGDLRYVFSTDPSIRGEWRREGVAFHAFSQKQSGTVPVYRYRMRDQHGVPRYLVSTRTSIRGWTRELVAFHAYSRARSNTRPVNEFYRMADGWYLGYSLDSRFGSSSGWRSGGRAFHVPEAPAASR